MTSPNLYVLCLSDKQSIKQGKVNVLQKSLCDKLIILDTYDPMYKNHSKLISILAYLQSEESKHIKDDDILVLVDAFDMIYIGGRPLIHLQTDFIKTNKKIIYGAEYLYSHHDIHLKPYWDNRYQGIKNRYLNSGGIITYKGYYRDLLQHIMKNFSKYVKVGSYSDQRIHGIHWACMATPQEQQDMELDTEQTFFYNYSVQQRPELIPGQVKTYFIHFPFLPHQIQKKRYKTFALHYVGFCTPAILNE